MNYKNQIKELYQDRLNNNILSNISDKELQPAIIDTVNNN